MLKTVVIAAFLLVGTATAACAYGGAGGGGALPASVVTDPEGFWGTYHPHHRRHHHEHVSVRHEEAPEIDVIEILPSYVPQADPPVVTEPAKKCFFFGLFCKHGEPHVR